MYSKGRKQEDMMTGRTIDPNHQFYESKAFDPPKTFGGKKGEPKS